MRELVVRPAAPARSGVGGFAPGGVAFRRCACRWVVPRPPLFGGRAPPAGLCSGVGRPAFFGCLLAGGAWGAGGARLWGCAFRWVFPRLLLCPAPQALRRSDNAYFPPLGRWRCSRRRPGGYCGAYFPPLGRKCCSHRRPGGYCGALFASLFFSAPRRRGGPCRAFRPGCGPFYFP